MKSEKKECYSCGRTIKCYEIKVQNNQGILLCKTCKKDYEIEFNDVIGVFDHVAIKTTND